MTLEQLARLYRAYFDHFEGNYYSPLHRDYARRSFVKWGMATRPNIDTFTGWVHYHKNNLSESMKQRYENECTETKQSPLETTTEKSTYK